jgi:hypothetical protein
MWMDIVLNAAEVASLFKQDPNTKTDGGFQSLLVGLQEKCSRATGALSLTSNEIGRIKKYAFDYGNGGWEDRLTAIFATSLGPRLDRVT